MVRGVSEAMSQVSDGVFVRPFGVLPDGRQVEQYLLRNCWGMQASIMTYGGIVTALTAPDREGRMADIVLGFDDLEGYLADHPYFGALIGRYGNRISSGAFDIDGRRYELTKNDGKSHLHGGACGFDKALWHAAPMSDAGCPQLRLHHVSEDGDEGYPGKLEATVTYSLNDENELRISYRATTDAPTHVNMTSHSYFNLGGADGRSCGDHMMTINADRFIVADENLIPTGEIREVAGTPMDFRRPNSIESRIDDDDEQLRFGGGYDHTWVLNEGPHPPTLAARVSDPESGRVMEVLTTEPGVQFYTANFLDGSLLGKGGSAYHRRCAFCLETQHYPDSPNRPEFPSTVLQPGEVFESTTVFRFTVE